MNRANLALKVLHHTAEHDCIRYALPSPLLADKIRTYSERRTRDNARRENDITDITFLLGSMIDAGTTMPDDLKTLILTDEVLEIFWNVLPGDDKAAYKEFLADIGFALGIRSLYLTLLSINNMLSQPQ
jgi:hypothetical protein